MLAAILQTAGYKAGLYTSPHLKQFTERIRVNGLEADQEFIVDFVNRIEPLIEKIQPSFFEITVAMTFDYFAQQKVDVAVIEVGMGGRLDSTNIIRPILSVITNIGMDHMDLLGDTLGKSALEKAGIIKPEVPVVISERQPEIDQVFISEANTNQAPIFFASDSFQQQHEKSLFTILRDQQPFLTDLQLDLLGDYQRKNILGVMQAVQVLREQDFKLTDEVIRLALKNVTTLTGLKGRWQKLGVQPLIICDTGHNVDGIREVTEQIKLQEFDKLHMILGMVKDKDILKVMTLLPKDAAYYFCQAKIPRALPAEDLSTRANEFGLKGIVIPDINEAIMYAKQRASPADMIFIGGSSFVVAEINDL
jgi:dihydrofolate synthase/folylpolyglutamate synthase